MGTLTHGSAPGITSNLNSTPGFVTAIEPNNNTTGTPQAYLTILFFDERFNFIAAADGGVAQQQVASSWTTSTPALALANIKAPKNGYAYAYISNRSDQSVYFDNLVVGVVAGNIIEEDHYYSFGLKIAAISSRKLGDAGEGNLQNNYQYQGSFSEMDADIGWNDFELRNYDAQTGRWVQQDPYDEFASPYSGMGNDPVLNTDPTGGCVLCETAEAAENLNQVVVIAYRASKTTVDMTHLALSLTSITVSAVRISIDAINNVTTNQAGKLIAQSRENRLIKPNGSPSDDGLSGTDRTLEGWEKETEDDAKKKMINLIEEGTSGSDIMRKVAMKMTNRFLNNNGGEFSDPDLDNAVSQDDNFKAFERKLLVRFQTALKDVGGDLNRLKPFLIGNPAFNRPVNDKDGLGITIHGVSYVEVHLLKFEINPKSGNFYVALKIDLYDNFGLGAEDLKIDNFFKQWYKWIGGVGLKAWYLLQHQFNHRPLRTHVQIDVGSHMNLNTIYKP